MPSRVFLNLLFFEILVIVVVGLIFRVIEARIVAGAVAGSVFVALGLGILVYGFLTAPFRRSFSFLLGAGHLLLIALPMMVTRLLNVSLAFDQVLIWGLPGPIFHRLSAYYYLALMAGSVLDFLRARREEKSAG